MERPENEENRKKNGNVMEWDETNNKIEWDGNGI